MNISDSLNAFQSASGVSPDKISLFIRTVLLVLTYIWAAWCVYGVVHHLRQGDVDIENTLTKIMRILFLITLVTILVFI